MYGTFTAAANYQHEFKKVLLEDVAMTQGGAYPNCFRHAVTGVQLTYHGDDIVLLGDEESWKAAETVIGLRFQVVRKPSYG
eukprot:4912940-Amphidinium_carterae.2